MVSDEGLRKLASAGCGPNLTSLNLIHCSSISDRGIKYLADAGCGRKLSLLNLQWQKLITDAGIRHLFRAGCGPSLQRFSFYHSSCSPDFVSALGFPKTFVGHPRAALVAYHAVSTLCESVRKHGEMLGVETALQHSDVKAFLGFQEDGVDASSLKKLFHAIQRERVPVMARSLPSSVWNDVLSYMPFDEYARLSTAESTPGASREFYHCLRNSLSEISLSKVPSSVYSGFWSCCNDSSGWRTSPRRVQGLSFLCFCLCEFCLLDCAVLT